MGCLVCWAVVSPSISTPDNVIQNAKNGFYLSLWPIHDIDVLFANNTLVNIEQFSDSRW